MWTLWSPHHENAFSPDEVNKSEFSLAGSDEPEMHADIIKICRQHTKILSAAQRP